MWTRFICWNRERYPGTTPPKNERCRELLETRLLRKQPSSPDADLHNKHEIHFAIRRRKAIGLTVLRSCQPRPIKIQNKYIETTAHIYGVLKPSMMAIANLQHQHLRVGHERGGFLVRASVRAYVCECRDARRPRNFNKLRSKSHWILMSYPSCLCARFCILMPRYFMESWEIGGSFGSRTRTADE